MTLKEVHFNQRRTQTITMKLNKETKSMLKQTIKEVQCLSMKRCYHIKCELLTASHCSKQKVLVTDGVMKQMLYYNKTIL